MKPTDWNWEGVAGATVEKGRIPNGQPMYIANPGTPPKEKNKMSGKTQRMRDSKGRFKKSAGSRKKGKSKKRKSNPEGGAATQKKTGMVRLSRLEKSFVRPQRWQDMVRHLAVGTGAYMIPGALQALIPVSWKAKLVSAFKRPEYVHLALDSAALVGGWFATKKIKALKKYRGAILFAMGIRAVQSLVRAVLKPTSTVGRHARSWLNVHASSTNAVTTNASTGQMTAGVRYTDEQGQTRVDNTGLMDNNLGDDHQGDGTHKIMYSDGDNFVGMDDRIVNHDDEDGAGTQNAVGSWLGYPPAPHVSGWSPNQGVGAAPQGAARQNVAPIRPVGPTVQPSRPRRQEKPAVPVWNPMGSLLAA
ncbi:MAG: hypothetical protein HRT44_06885 [Bdellovibrionales bacterium]|nr:hypothetical protein [Bdellovibrionales bacterium]